MEMMKISVDMQDKIRASSNVVYSVRHFKPREMYG